MSYYGTTQTQQQAPTMSSYHQMRMPMNYAGMNATINNQMNFMHRNFMAQAQNTQTSGLAVAAAVAPPPKTLELKVVGEDMCPRSASVDSSSVTATLASLFCRLPAEDCALLQLIEVFAFHYRTKRPYEPTVMGNARLYVSRLRSKNSQLANHIDGITGFRCVACSHTTIGEGAENGYVVGAAQLIAAEHLHPRLIQETIQQLKNHMMQCPHIQDHIRRALTQGVGTGGAAPAAGGLASLESYLGVWVKTLRTFSEKHGYPKLKAIRTSAAAAQQPQPPPPRTLVDPSVSQLQRSLGNFQQAQRAGMLYTAHPPSSPQQPEEDTEDIVRWELEECVHQGLVGNNYGVARVKPRTIAANLSEFRMSAPHEVSPLLELLLQSLCAIQRWRSPASGTKRSHQELSESSSRLSNVYFECSYCNSHTICGSTATPREVADFILSATCQHLCEECDEVPGGMQEKLEQMRQQMTDIERSAQARVIAQSLPSWKSQFPDNTGGKKGSTKRVRESKCWRPLSWEFLEENTAACIADASLVHKGPSVFLEFGEAKKLPFAAGPDDVLFGWNGKHLGNRRFLDLLVDVRKVFYDSDEGLTQHQQTILAAEVFRTIDQRKGKFFRVGHNHMLPPTLIVPGMAVNLILRTIKRGNFVLLQTPPDLSKRGRGCRILECEVAPQRSLYGTGKEIVRNKRFKKALPEEENA